MTAQQILDSAARREALQRVIDSQDEQHRRLMWFAVVVVVCGGLLLFALNRGWAFLKDFKDRKGEWR